MDVSQFDQSEYPIQLYQSELSNHELTLDEYELDIFETIIESIDNTKPNLDLYKQQPYLTLSIRLKLIDFLLKMTIRLKILPFVFYKAIKIFDRYCSKRIVLLDQSQLIITTCLWIAAKYQGGNNHFINLSNLNKLSKIKTINDLGYGSGGKYLGPTERFRLPKLHELVKLCGAKCKYDVGMFKQMEIHVLSTLDWGLNDASIEEFIINESEFNILPSLDMTVDSLSSNEFFKIKQYLSYTSLYSFDLIDVNIIHLAIVMVDLINETFNLKENKQKLNYSKHIDTTIDTTTYDFIKKKLIKSILNSTDFILKLFNTQGPQFLYHQINIHYKFSEPNDHSPIHYNMVRLPSTPQKRSTSISPTHGSPEMVLKKKSPSSVITPYGISTPPYSIPPAYQINSFYSPVIKVKQPPSHVLIRKHNGSCTSLTNSDKSTNEEHEIFEYDTYKRITSTPLSENDSPIFALKH